MKKAFEHNGVVILPAGKENRYIAEHLETRVTLEFDKTAPNEKQKAHAPEGLTDASVLAGAMGSIGEAIYEFLKSSED